MYRLNEVILKEGDCILSLKDKKCFRIINLEGKNVTVKNEDDLDDYNLSFFTEMLLIISRNVHSIN